jgi:O-antigen ligase
MLLNEKNKNVFDIVLHVTLIIIFLVSLLQFLSNSLLFTEQFRSPDNINELMKFGDKLRIPSLFKHTYALAEFNFYVFPFVLANILNCKTRSKRIYNIIICSSILATTLWSRQRMGLVILLFQFTTMYILAKDIRLDIRSLLNILKLVTIATIVILCVLITEDGQMLFVRTVNTILNPLNDQQDALSLIARIFRINVAWNIFLDYPIWGAGIGTSELLYPEYGWDIKSSSGGPHNLYLFLLAETGLIGFIAFIAGWVHYIKYFWNNIRYNDGNININVLAGFIFTTTILINGMFTGVLYGSSIVFLIIFLVYAYTFLPCNQFNTPINT